MLLIGVVEIVDWILRISAWSQSAAAGVFREVVFGKLEAVLPRSLVDGLSE